MKPATGSLPPSGRKRQERGRRRIESILDAAEALIAEVGYDAATTNLIAARAGISPGSLYQYFANKPAIVEALAARYLHHLAEAHGGLFGPQLADLPLPELMDRIVDPLIAFNLAHPAVRPLLAGAAVSPDLAEAISNLHEALCDRVEELIGTRASHRSARDRQLAATVTIQIFSSLLPVIAAANRRDRPRIIRELKAALASYWASIEQPNTTP